MKTKRPNLGYSNYYWIRVDQRERMKASEIKKEELESAKPLDNFTLNLDIKEIITNCNTEEVLDIITKSKKDNTDDKE